MSDAAARDECEEMVAEARRESGSLFMRKVSEHILLGPEIDEERRTPSEDGFCEDDGVEKEGSAGQKKRGLLQKTCLRPQFSLRRQMMLSFGLVSALTVLFVMVISIIVSISAGNSVKSTSKENLQDLARLKASSSARYVAEAFELTMPSDVSQILREAVRDRFVGYPDHEGYEDDVHVPFFDIDSGRNRYPLDAQPLPLDWQIQANVNDDNYDEHVQDRWPLYSKNLRLSTSSAFYGMQGACDPSVSDPDHIDYYPNCTDANNNVTSGGAVKPTATNQQIFLKAKDLNPIFKSLYEYSNITKELGIFFANAGAGSMAMFPHYEIDYTKSYTSIGCEWMKQRNPLDSSKTIGTNEEIERCHRKGDSVSNKEYNPLERAWCRDQALNPDRIMFAGPYLDAFSDHQWLMTVGQAIYDRITNDLIGCTLVDVVLDHVVEILEKVRISDLSQVTLVKWDDNGTVVASPRWNSTASMDTAAIDDPELDLGIDKATFQELKTLIDFGGDWNPQDVRKTFAESKLFKVEGKFISSYPVPPPPDAHDTTYRPDFMVIVSLEESDIFRSFYDLDQAVDQEVEELVVFTLTFGFAGLAFVLSIICIVSHCLTRPFQWMHDVADQLINKFGSDIDLGTDLNRSTVFRFSPKTELSDLMQEFQQMVSQFSGEGTAKAVWFGCELTEVKNRFTLLDEFKQLYLSRLDPDFKFDYDTLPTSSQGKMDSWESWEKDFEGTVSSGMTRRLHYGPNISAPAGDTSTSAATAKEAPVQDKKHVLTSPLFWWVVGLIITPLLVTTVTISVVVTWNISTQFTSLDAVVQEEYLELEKQVMSTSTNMRAVQASEVTKRAVRDLHVLSRVAGWLLFSGVGRSTSFTEMTTAAEQCKKSPEKGTCDYFRDTVCDCKWKDQSSESCHNYTNDTRYLQRVYWEGQRQDAWSNGDRNYTSFPNVSTSPKSTAFWADVTELPGSKKGPLASGYETTYDRLRVISALSTVQMPLYNYDVSKNKPFGTYVGFEADGMLIGNTGCNDGHADFSFFNSSHSNGAAKLRPDLCPEGKFGYDARCRDWYVAGNRFAEKRLAPLYVTAPYMFPTNGLVAQGCSAPLIDPNTQVHVGRALVDFIPNSIFVSLLPQNTPLAPGGFPFLITAEKDILGTDTVIGPGFEIGDPGKPIEEVVLPNDHHCSASDGCIAQHSFYNITKEMQAGGKGLTSFERTSLDGSIEKIVLSYAPVNVTSFRPLNNSDFSRGVEEFNSVMYSLGMAQPEKELLEPFQDVGDDIQKQVDISIGVLAALIVLSSAFVTYISSRVTLSITVPILHLLTSVRNINRLENKDDFLPPTENTGSREVLAIYDTFTMLFKVVRFANSAFFSGDLENAYQVMVDALRLFKSLDNEKAIGVASNNLGNCMLTMYRLMEVNNTRKICGLSKEEIIAEGTAYFRDSIKLGEEAYDKFYEEEGWSANCLAFMQHLSNRYFNRAIFLLTVKNDHKWPDEAHRLGCRDLEIVIDMDVEVADQCIEVGFSIDKAEHFDLMLNRIRGFLSLMELPYNTLDPEKLSVADLFHQTFKELKAAVKDPSSGLFRDVSPAGRMQQLDAELIKYVQLSNRTEEAARIGIRMLIEDEYIFHDALSKAAKALVDYVDVLRDESPQGITSQTIAQLDTFHDQLIKDVNDSLRDSRAQEAKGRRLSESLMSRLSQSSATSRHSLAFRGDFTMEVF